MPPCGLLRRLRDLVSSRCQGLRLWSVPAAPAGRTHPHTKAFSTFAETFAPLARAGTGAALQITSLDVWCGPMVNGLRVRGTYRPDPLAPGAGATAVAVESKEHWGTHASPKLQARAHCDGVRPATARTTAGDAAELVDDAAFSRSQN